MSEFLKKEYEQCLALLKFYDERQFSLVKYSATITSAAPTLLVAIYKLGSESTEYFWHFALLLSITSSVALASIFIGIVQTRLYFIYPARQMNSIRAYLIKGDTEAGFSNHMYLSTSFNAFKWSSTQTLMMAFVALEIGFFISSAVYAAYKVVPENGIVLALVGLFGALAAAALVGAAAYYLHVSSMESPDKSVHREG